MTISKVYHCNFRLSPILMGYLQTWVTCFLDGRSDSIQPRQRSLYISFFYSNIVTNNIWIVLNRNFTLTIMVNIKFSNSAFTNIQHNTQYNHKCINILPCKILNWKYKYLEKIRLLGICLLIH